jgi:gliding motility-associated-like protein
VKSQLRTIQIFLFVLGLTIPSVYGQLGFCTGNSGNPIFLEDFGTGSDYGPPLASATTTYEFISSAEPQDGQYTIGSNTLSLNWNLPADHTPNDTNGKCLIVNASFTPGEFYKTSITGLCENTTYEFSSWLINILPSSGCEGNGIPVNVKFEIWDVDDTNLLASGDTGDIQGMATPTWQQYGLVFQTLPSQTSVILKMINNGIGGCGNDLAIDDISFSTCGDFITVLDDNNNNQLAICENEIPYNLQLTATPDFSVYSSHFYQWQESTDGTVWVDISGETNQAFTISLTSPMFYRVKVAEDAVNLGNFQCISLSDVFETNINANPDAPVSDGDTSFNCNFNEAILSVTVPSGISVNWYDAINSGNLLESNSSTYTATTQGDFYAEAVDDTTGCISSVRTIISAASDPIAVPVSNGDVGLNCSTGEAFLSVIVPNGITVNWYDADNGGNLLESNSTTYNASELGTYYAEAIDESTGCISATRVPVNVSILIQTENCIIPQGISPGVSPGLNDTFDLSNFNVTKIEIFNRYGTLVYSKDNYTNEWYGQSDKGDQLPVGTYFYTMTYEGGAKAKSAWVYIIQ